MPLEKTMADPDPQIPRRAVPLWLRIVFVLSLAANLAVIGLIVGIATSPKGPRGPDRFVGDVAAAPFVRALPDEDRRALTRQMIEASGGFRDLRRQTRERAEALFAALRAETFDRAAVEALLETQREQAGDRQKAGEMILLDHLEQMPHAERVAYAERLAETLRRPRKDGRPRD